MLQEKTLKRIALFVLIVGLAFLYFYADEFEVESVGSLEHYGVQEHVKIHGVVQSIRSFDNVTFINVEGTRFEKMDVVVFEDEYILLEEGDYVEVEGRVELYKGKKEVIGEKVIVR